MFEQSTALPYQNTEKRSVLDNFLFGAMSSLRTIPDFFNHRVLGIRPPSLFWLARVTKCLKSNHRRTAFDCPKAKTPQDALWSRLLARATARRLNVFKRLACRTTRPHSTLRG